MSYTQLRIHKPTLAKLRMLATLRQENIASLVDRLAEREIDTLDEATAALIREQAGKDREDPPSPGA